MDVVVLVSAVVSAVVSVITDWKTAQRESIHWVSIPDIILSHDQRRVHILPRDRGLFNVAPGWSRKRPLGDKHMWARQAGDVVSGTPLQEANQISSICSYLLPELGPDYLNKEQKKCFAER